MAGSKTCPKCNGRMTQGHLLDANYGESSTSPVRWQPGEITKSWTGSIKIDKEAVKQVTTHRCDKCGYLESYAN